MASFEEHIIQVKKNLIFLEEVNSKINTQWDWQVTICFYVAVHLVNAHIARKTNSHYRSHEQVNHALNPFNQLSLNKLPESVYLSYIKLQNLSRRSRYLCSEATGNLDVRAFHTSEKYLAKALRELNNVIEYFDVEYDISIPIIKVDCSRIKNDSLKYFRYYSPNLRA